MTRRLIRLFAVWTLFVGMFACGDTGCDCVGPLEAPPDAANRVYDAVQLRLTPAALDMVESELPTLLAGLMPEGLSFEVPPMQEVIDAVIFTIAIDICPAGCTLNADIKGASLTAVAPDLLQLDALLDMSGMIFIGGDVECDVPVHVVDKPLHADILFSIDERDGLMRFEVSGISLELTDEDFSLECYGTLAELIEALKGFMVTMMNEQLAGQLDEMLAGSLGAAACLPCDFYTGGCPGDSTCDVDEQICFEEPSCRAVPLGLVGSVDMGALLADLLPGLNAMLDMELAVGQELQAIDDPLVEAGGLSMRMFAGLDAEPSACVPVPADEDIPSLIIPARMPMPVDELVPSTGEPYMLALAVADTFMDQALYHAYRGGLLCLDLDTEATGGLLSSGTMSALLGSLNKLTGGLDVPMKLRLRPQHIPSAEFGAGTFTVDAQGQKIIDEPLLAILMPETALDFYALIDERWVKLATLTQDISLLLGLELLPDNRLLPTFDESSIVIENVVATDYELLAEDPLVLENLLPTLLGLAMPMLTESLGVIEVPGVEGFVLRVQALEPSLERVDTPWYEYLAIYAELAMEAPVTRRRHLDVQLQSLRMPSLGEMSIFAPGGPTLPQAMLRISADDPRPFEISWRLDGGGWSVFRSGPEILIRSPLLALRAEHRLELRTRLVGDYR
ncbi:MAG: hypothetical protein JRF33_27115, partial [Deltaproteobacteria bacterium]|nr:hypothetical protein [Deltaproteobacteria bacterium]